MHCVVRLRKSNCGASVVYISIFIPNASASLAMIAPGASKISPLAQARSAASVRFVHCRAP